MEEKQQRKLLKHMPESETTVRWRNSSEAELHAVYVPIKEKNMDAFLVCNEWKPVLKTEMRKKTVKRRKDLFGAKCTQNDTMAHPEVPRYVQKTQCSPSPKTESPR